MGDRTAAFFLVAAHVAATDSWRLATKSYIGYTELLIFSTSLTLQDPHYAQNVRITPALTYTVFDSVPLLQKFGH